MTHPEGTITREETSSGDTYTYNLFQNRPSGQHSCDAKRCGRYFASIPKNRLLSFRALVRKQQSEQEQVPV